MGEIIEERNQLIFNFNEFLPDELSPYARLVLIKFISLFGTEKISDALLELSQKIGVQHKKLKVVLEELSGCGILELSYPESGRRARVRTIQLNLQYLNQALSKTSHLETPQRRYTRLKKAIKQFDLLIIIFIRLSQARVTTKKFDLPHVQKLDFRVLLTLLYLTRSCDVYGVIRNIGTTQLMAKTGLQKQAIFDSIRILKNIGLLRAHVHGTINNKFIKKITPIYVINLSHLFWGNHAKYGRFFIQHTNAGHFLELKMIADIFAVICEHLKKIHFEKPLDIDSGTELILQALELDTMSHVTGILNRFVLPSAQDQERILKFIKECLIHYLHLQQCHQMQGDLTVFARVFKQASVNQNKKYIELNDFSSNLTIMQCYLESWCCRLLDQRRLRQDVVHGIQLCSVDILNRTTMVNDLYPFAMDDGYRLALIASLESRGNHESIKEHDQDIDLQIQKLERQEQSIIQEFLLFCMNVIIHHQVFPFLNSTATHTHLIGRSFQIMPQAAAKHKMYSCIYVPDPMSTRDEFFLINIDYSIDEMAQRSSITDYVLQSIDPDDQDLKHYGLLDRSFSLNR